MPLDQRPPPPVEALRDLVGITRALYASERARGAGERRLAELEQAGKELAQALKLARSPAGSLGAKAAWTWAERGYERLLQQITLMMPLAPVLEAAVNRVLR